MEVVSLIVEPVVKALTGHITQKLRNLTSSADRVKKMIKKWEDLDEKRSGIENRMSENEVNIRKIPPRAPGWLKKVEKIKEDVDNIPSNNIGCFNVKKKYLAGRDALSVTEDIERLINEYDKISDDTIWREPKGCLGRVDSQNQASTSTSGESVFDSRVKALNDARKLLQQDDAARVIALCGMGGVGKTTLKKQLKEVAIKEKMFNCIVDVVIGNTPNLLKIQKEIAVQTGEPLTETDLMATYLSKRFEVFSERKEKTLVILDDVWEKSKIKLEDIGLASPLPNGVKLLLTSRDVKVCRQIAKDAALKVVEVNVLKENEAQDFFCQKADISAEHDHDLYEIGCEIVKKCGCLPLAIELIAGTLKCETDRAVWRCTRDRLKINDLDENVQKIIEISYESITREEDKAIFLLCGLFPEDSNIPIEDLTRYAWGLKLLKQVSTMGKARDSTHTSVSNLKNAYLLMDGDSHHSDCVKLHDLVLAFVVATVSKGGEGCWIIHHKDDFSNWSEANSMSQSCEQISLACNGMSKFPSDFRFPKLRLLKLMQGDESLKFPEEFYEGMEKLQVIAFEKLAHPLVPTSVQFADLRTLCLHECSLMFDLACIGNLSNLEVLSFANSGITILPSTFGNLKKLRLLDVTGCCNLVIDDGVLKRLVKLEELYMRGRALRFTDNNRSEFAERSEHLSALEFEFIGNNAHMKNVSCKKLKRFKLSVGCSFTEVKNELGTRQVDTHSYENSLNLITNREELELLKSMINELFKITDALYLQVNDMNTLPYSWFSNLRLLVVSKCAELTYLFTPSVATNLSKLEYLEISSCNAMEAVVHTENNGSDIITENSGSDIIKFSNLKYLRLANLPKLLSFSNKVNVIELPRLVELQLQGLPNFTSIYPSNTSSSVSSNISRMQSFFHKEDATPILEELVVYDMEKLKEIWPPQFSISNLCPLRELTVEGCGSIEVLFNMDFGGIEQPTGSLRSIEVSRCDSLVKLFSCNPFPFLNNLQELEVTECASIEVIFDIDMGCVGEMDKVSSSRLRSIDLRELGKLREVWRIKDAGNNNLIHGFEAVESILIIYCERFENLITPATTTFDFDMRALKLFQTISCSRESEKKNELAESNQDQEIDVVSISKVALPFSLLPTFHHLHTLCLYDYKAVEVVFEITTPSSRESPHNTQQPPILPYLEKLKLENMGRMSRVWKCNWNELLILQKPLSQSSFHNLTTIRMTRCNSIKYLFSPLMAKLLSNLKEVDIQICDAIEEVVSNRDDEDASIYSHTTTTFFPHLDILDFFELKNLKCIGGSANGISADIHDQLKLSQASWSLCQYAREIRVRDCDALSSVIPWYAVGQTQKLQVLDIIDCKSMTEVFETKEIKNKSGLPRLEYITMLKLPKLKILEIEGCNLLEHIFTFSTLETLVELEKLKIRDCERMEVIVKKESGELTTTSDVVVFPRLKSLILFNLPNFVGFFLGKSEFIWPTLEEEVIHECPQITVSGPITKF